MPSPGLGVSIDYIKFQYVAKNIAESCFFFPFSFFIAIWLSHLMDDHHLNYIGNLKLKTLEFLW